MQSPDAQDRNAATKAATTNVVSIFGVALDANDPLTYFLFLGILTIILVLLAQRNGGLALGLALTALLGIAFAHN